jgi:hypothetical protein
MLMPSLSVQAAAPSVPSNLVATSTTPTSVTLTWSASTDDDGVTGYNVYRNGATTSIAATASSVLTYLDLGLTPATAYAYNVASKDAAGNISVLSSTSYITTLASTTATTTPISTTTPPIATSTINPTIKVVGNENDGKQVNLKSNAKIKVIVFASSTFDPKNIVLSSVTFGGAKADLNYRFDHNRDRKADRVFEFRASNMVDLINKNATGSIPVTFKAVTTSGQQITFTATLKIKNFKQWKQDRQYEQKIEAQKKALEAKKKAAEIAKEKIKMQQERIKKQQEALRETNKKINEKKQSLKKNKD